MIAIYIATTGILDDIQEIDVQRFEASFRLFLEGEAKELIERINTETDFTEEDQKEIKKLAEEYKKSF